uniref:Transposase n=1 Tax=Steinernema glaseri TaxID=37863 RepID=A0A1I8A1J8_9BILA
MLKRVTRNSQSDPIGGYGQIKRIGDSHRAMGSGYKNESATLVALNPELAMSKKATREVQLNVLWSKTRKNKEYSNARSGYKTDRPLWKYLEI